MVSAPIIEFEPESITQTAGANDTDDLDVSFRFKITDSRTDRTPARTRQIAREIVVDLRENLSNHWDRFEYSISDIVNMGRWRVLNLTTRFQIHVNRLTQFLGG